MSERSSKKQKRNVDQDEYGTTCLCCNPKCDEAMAKLLKYNPSRHAYFRLPKEPKDEKELSGKPRPNQIAQRYRKTLKRERILAALPKEARTRANDTRYNNTSMKEFASLHLHDKIYNLCPTIETSIGSRKSLVDSIPSELANELSREHNCKFTSTDKFEDGTYVPLPNVSPESFISYANELERNAIRAIDTTPREDQRPTRNSPVTSEGLQNEQLAEQMSRQAAQIELQKVELKKINKAVEERKKELEKLKLEVAHRQHDAAARQQDVHEKLKLLETSAEIYGLTRTALLSKSWHKNHPEAAKHLFGFKSWKETVYMLHALFGVLPPMKIPKRDEHVSKFERYLMGYMRIHLRMSVTQISYIWDRDRGHTGRLIKDAVVSIGGAGKDLSILHITPEFLEKTCPQQYKDEGLEKCCGVPDGKDFMIYTTRKNTLFTRASYSDKMHASAVRCISWSTPMGLSYEHTDLFLGRVSEKKLVELWGPRLKKCPRGWYMLSDRGFFDTARFYPNMNHQKTPKFLSGRDQFTEDEISADRRICKLRYTCEVAFSRVTKTQGLRDVISNDFFPFLDAMNHWGHATVNLDAPLMS